MTKSDLTMLGVLVDRSGSMEAMRNDMEPGLAKLLEEQAKEPGQCQVSLAQFDNEYDQVWTLRDIKNVPHYSLVPRGSTALLDALGRFISDVGAELASRPEEERPGKVAIVLITDGYENSSKEWTKSQVKELVEKQRNDYNWDFVFLGANIDAMAEGGDLGVAAASSMTFSGANAAAAMGSVSNYISSYRTSGVASFSDQDREKAMEEK